MILDNPVFIPETLPEKIAYSIALLRKHEPQDKPYRLAFSGGKDSIVIKDLADKAGVKYEAHFACTSIDPPELLNFIREYHKDAIWHRPKLTMFQLIEKKKMLPTRQIRFCCEHLKEYLGFEHNLITGIRMSESTRRAKRKEIEIDGSKYFVHPIFHWSDKDVWDYIKLNNLPYCCLYDEGFARIGCIGCPMHNALQRGYEFNKWKNHRKAYINTINKFWDYSGIRSNFKDAEDVFNWWCSGLSMRRYLADKKQMEIKF